MESRIWTIAAAALFAGSVAAGPALAQSSKSGQSQSAQSGASQSSQSANSSPSENASGGQSSPSALEQRSEDNDTDWGWIGLLGLAGLLGLRRRRDTDVPRDAGAGRGPGVYNR